MSDLPLHKQVGFDYPAAVRELLEKMTYMELADRIGYEGVGSIGAILHGAVPSHVRGEALWALYCDTFGRKPPLTRKSECVGVMPSV